MKHEYRWPALGAWLLLVAVSCTTDTDDKSDNTTGGLVAQTNPESDDTGSDSPEEAEPFALESGVNTITWEEDLSIGTTTRHMVIHTPASYPDHGPLPVVFAFHGNAADAPDGAEPGKQWLKGYQKAQTDSRSSYTDPFTRDPDSLDRANYAHSRIQNELRDFIRDAGHRTSSPKSSQINFDLAWEARGVLYVAEVKSIIDSNEQSQLRLGLGQVLHYKRQLREHFDEVEAVLVVERKPSDPIWEGVCEMAGVTLAWPGEFMRCLQAPAAPGEEDSSVPEWFTQLLEDE